MLSYLNLRPYKIQFMQPLNKDYKKNSFRTKYKTTDKQRWHNVKQIFSLTKLIFIYADILTNKITSFWHTRNLT